VKINWTLVGFLTFILGFLSFILSLLGLKFVPLAWLQNLSPALMIVCQMILIFGGVIIMYVSKTSNEETV
jgi:hypothetical protein